jgi:hypothetical protein
LQRSPDGGVLNNSTAWKEDPLYTAWLQDYKHVYKWSWVPFSRPD